MSAPIALPVPPSNAPFHSLAPLPIALPPGSHQPAPLDTSHSAYSAFSPSNPSSAQTCSIFTNLSSAPGSSPVSSFQTPHSSASHPIQSGLMFSNPNSVTRILILSEFNKDLKTRDIQSVFADWEDDRGGFKIKWIDDTTCLIVFADPTVAKRAFLGVLANPSPLLVNPNPSPDGPFPPGHLAKLRAYNGPDVMHILASVQNRPRSRSNASQTLHSRASSLASSNNNGLANGLGRRPSMGALAARHRSSLSAAPGVSRAPVSSISASNSANITINGQSIGTVPATSGAEESVSAAATGRARIDDAGKRFLTAGLGKPNSTMGHLPISEVDEAANSAAYSLTNLTIEEEATTPTAASH